MKKYFKAVFTLILTVICMGISGLMQTDAAEGGSVSVAEIDYEKMTITIQAGSADTKIFLSNASQKTWEEVYGELDSNRQITMDISWASQTSNTVLSFKGDASTTPIKVTLPAQPKGLKVTYDYLTGKLTVTGIENVDTVYWKKKDGTVWNALALTNNQADVSKQLEGFMTQGVTLTFRTGQTKGNAAGVGTRPSKETTLKISKKASAPAVSLDRSKLSVTLKNTMEYRLAGESNWIKVNESRAYTLAELAPGALYKTDNLMKAEVLEVRTSATEKKTASAIADISIPAQKETTGTVSVSFVSSTKMTFTITEEASETTPSEGVEETASETEKKEIVYQYTVMKYNEEKNAPEELDLSKASWTDIKSAKEVELTSEKAPAGSRIYIRKAATDKELATAPVSIDIDKYPDAASLKEEAALTKIQGVDKNLTFVVCVPAGVVTDNESDVSVLRTEFGGRAATITASAVTLLSGTEADGVYGITVTITSTEGIEAVESNIGKVLEGKITLTNGEVIEEGVTLYIAKAASAGSVGFTKYENIAVTDDVKFEVKLNDTADEYTKNAQSVNMVTVNGRQLNFTPVSDSDGTIKITISAADINSSLDAMIGEANYGKSYNLEITLNNGEVINTTGSGIVVKYAANVTGDSSGRSGMGISAASYNNAKLTAAEANTTIDSYFKNPEVNVVIEEEVYSMNANYMVESVTWNGANVLYGYTQNANTFSVVIDLEKVVVNQPGSHNVVFILMTTDGSSVITVEKGYAITLSE